MYFLQNTNMTNYSLIHIKFNFELKYIHIVHVYNIDLYKLLAIYIK